MSEKSDLIIGYKLTLRRRIGGAELAGAESAAPNWLGAEAAAPSWRRRIGSAELSRTQKTRSRLGGL